MLHREILGGEPPDADLVIAVRRLDDVRCRRRSNLGPMRRLKTRQCSPVWCRARFQRAISIASRTMSVRMWDATRQPTIIRE